MNKDGTASWWHTVKAGTQQRPDRWWWLRTLLFLMVRAMLWLWLDSHHN